VTRAARTSTSHGHVPQPPPGCDHVEVDEGDDAPVAEHDVLGIQIVVADDRTADRVADAHDRVTGVHPAGETFFVVHRAIMARPS
jgi:hypothetical protein